jgi:uncharacterized repeat protein (TIGR02543 family)
MKKVLCLGLLVLLLLPVLPTKAFGANVPVPTTNTIGSVAELKVAMETAQDGDVLTLGPAFTSDLAANGPVVASLSTANSFTVVGDPGVPLTVPSGTRHFNITNPLGAKVTFKDLTLAGASATGGILLNGGAYAFDNCTFSTIGNPALAVTNNAANIEVAHSSFVNNTGGALRVIGGTATTPASYSVQHCYFDGNTLTNGRGAAIYGDGSYYTLDVQQSVFINNRVDGTSTAHKGNNRVDGGAIMVDADNKYDVFVNIKGSNFEGNFAQDDGGAITIQGTHTRTSVQSSVSNCTFAGNTCAGAQYGNTAAWITDGSGGAINYYAMTRSEITHCTFYANGVTNVLAPGSKGFNMGNVGGGGAIGVDTDEKLVTNPDQLPPCPVLSNNIFIANFTVNPASDSTISIINKVTGNSLGSRSERSKTGNVFVLPATDADLQASDKRTMNNNGNVGYDNKNPDYNNAGINTKAQITVDNVFANTVGGVPVKEYFGMAEGSATTNAQRYCYIPSPRTDEMYRDGSGPYYDPYVRTDVRDYPRDHFPNAGAVEIYWTKFDPGVANQGKWTDKTMLTTPPLQGIQSLLDSEIYYLVTTPGGTLTTFPRATIDIASPDFGLLGWEGNQPSNPTAAPADFVFPLVQPNTEFVSTKQTFTAKWEKERFRVDFDLGYAGLWGTPYTRILKGDTIAAPTKPVRTDYTFDGWYRDAATTVAWDFNSDTVTGDLVLYARWKEAVVNPPAPPNPQDPSTPPNPQDPPAPPAPPTPPAPPAPPAPTPPPAPTKPPKPATPPKPSAPPAPSKPPVSPSTPQTPKPEPKPESKPEQPPAKSETKSSKPKQAPDKPARPKDTNPSEAKPEQHDQASNPSRGVTDGTVPLGGIGVRDAWSLLNLIMSLLSIALSLLLLVSTLLKRRNAKQQAQQKSGGEAVPETNPRPWNTLKALALLSGLLPLLLFLILEGSKPHIAWVTQWTPVIAVFFLVNIALVVLQRVQGKPKKETDGPGRP